jgi:hypothetical protein
MWWCVFAAFTVISLWPIWSERFPPMQDYPEHLARARMLCTPQDSALDFHQNFDIHLRPLYASFFLVTIFFSKFVGLECAGKLAISLYVVLVMTLVLVQARRSRLEVPPWGLLLFFPLAFNQQYYLGFVNFCYSVPLLLLTLLDQQDLASAPLGRWRIGKQCLLQAVLFITHPFTFLIYLALATVAATFRWRDRTRAKRMAVSPLIGLVLLFAWLVVAKRIGLLSGVSSQSAFGWKPLSETIGFYCCMFTGMRWHDGVDSNIAVVWMIALACLIFACFTDDEPTHRFPHHVVAFFVLTTLAMLALPFFVNDSESTVHYTFFNFRISSISYFMLGWLVGTVRFRGPCAALFVGCLLVILLASAGKQMEISRGIQEIAPIIEKIPPNERILPLVFNRRTPELDPVYFQVHLHAPEYYHALVGGGVTPYFFPDPLHPATLRPGAAPPAPNEDMPFLFRWDQHGSGYRYFLTRDAPMDFVWYLSETTELKARSGKWLLFERKPEAATNRNTAR